MKKVKCIAFDLDRTALDSSGRLPERNRAAVQSAAERGMTVVIASGRPYTALPADVTDIPGIAYAVTGNGCAVYRLPEGSSLRTFYLHDEAAPAILELCRSLPVKYECFINGQGYIDAEFYADPMRFNIPYAGVEYIHRSRIPVDDIQSFILTNRHRLEALDVITPDDGIRQLAADIIADSVSGLYLTTSAPTLLEISSHQCGKWSGLKFILELEGISPEETAAFGDNDNDADMLAGAGLSFAMSNATPLCRAAAKYTTASNDECGVAIEIEKLLGIK